MKRFIAGLLLLPLPLTAQSDSLVVRIADVGPGLCTITWAPGDAYMVYDAGHWLGQRCLEVARELIPGGEIDLMVISHSDSDHMGDADQILHEFSVRQFLHTGFEREGTATWERMMDTLASQVRHQGLSVRSLTTQPIVPGEKIALGGDVFLTLLGGWGSFPGELSGAEHRNAGSIVLRLDYAGRSVLFAGDAVGRHIGDPPEACGYAEEILVDRHRSNVFSLAADVLIAPHHGADNASSACFIDAVDPEWVIFSAGHRFEHPRRSTADRFLDQRIPRDRILRTDRGDSEGEEEWRQGAIPGCADSSGDDDIRIVIRHEGTLRVEYLEAAGGC